MAGKRQPRQTWTRHRNRLILLGIGIMTVVGLSGCSDHRISLAEFIAMEQPATRGPTTRPAETQPAGIPDEVIAALNQHLSPYKLGFGDVLRVTLTGAEQTTVTPPLQVRVNREGQVELPIVGPVKVADMELVDADKTVHDAYVPKAFRELVVHVELFTPDTTGVLVTGAVQAPGMVQLRRTERNLLFAIIGAGGATDAASGSVRLKRLRRPGDEVTLNLREPDQLRAALSLDPLEKGDILTVEAATPNTVFVGGLVNTPHPQMYPPGVQMNVLQAIAASGGLRTDVTPREATLIRHTPDGRDVQVKLNMDRVSTGKDPNLVLAAGDVLWVNETLETRIQDWINRNVFFRVGATATAGANYGLDYSMPGTDYLNSAALRRFQTGSSGGGSGTLADRFDPFGFLTQGQVLQSQTQALQNLATGK